MKLWIWILIIVAVAAIAFFVGRANGKKLPVPGEAEKTAKELVKPVEKTGLDQKASAKG